MPSSRIDSRTFTLLLLLSAFRFNRSTVKQGFSSVKADALDAFIYDATVLEYLVGQDDECNILTVGSWYAMTGYGVAFPKGSKWIPHFNEYLMKYRENGDLERMQRFWFTGACEPRKRRRTSSKPLALAQFMSAFLLLGCGITFSGFLLLLEHCYFRYVRRYLAASSVGRAGFCSLLSLSVAESLRTWAKMAAAGNGNNGKEENSKALTDGRKPPADKVLEKECSPARTCRDPKCEMNITAVARELDAANRAIEFLQKQLLEIESKKSPAARPNIHLNRFSAVVTSPDDDESEPEEMMVSASTSGETLGPDGPRRVTWQSPPTPPVRDYDDPPPRVFVADQPRQLIRRKCKCNVKHNINEFETVL